MLKTNAVKLYIGLYNFNAYMVLNMTLAVGMLVPINAEVRIPRIDT